MRSLADKEDWDQMNRGRRRASTGSICGWGGGGVGEGEECEVWDVQGDGVSGSQRHGGSVPAASTCTARSRMPFV